MRGMFTTREWVILIAGWLAIGAVASGLLALWAPYL